MGDRLSEARIAVAQRMSDDLGALLDARLHLRSFSRLLDFSTDYGHGRFAVP
jgi:hypothetical protein